MVIIIIIILIIVIIVTRRLGFWSRVDPLGCGLGFRV